MSNLYRHMVARLGLGDLLWRFRRPGLYCFNFHRIGDWTSTPFDPCVFSCTAEDLDKYLDFFKSEFKVVTLAEVRSLAMKGQKLEEPVAHITFDDGYRDSYTVALPILKRHGLSATFFITTSLIGTRAVSWWDEIAWHVKQLGVRDLQLPGWTKAIELESTDARSDVRRVLGEVKSTKGTTVDAQLHALRELTGELPEQTEIKNLFMDWSDLEDLSSSGMSIGAHSHSHEQFSRLSQSELEYELRQSKTMLEERIGIEIDSLSYPVGSSQSFSQDMFSVIEHCGYSIAFSFNQVVTRQLHAHRYQLGRISIDTAFNRQEVVDRLVTLTRI